MISASEILEMIEKVDPDDETTLREIDIRVYVFLKLNEDFQVSIHKGGRSITYRHNLWPQDERSVLFHTFDRYRYTRCRNKLKSIRPRYVEIDIFHRHSSSECEIWLDRNVSVKSPALPTEELAELHAIIQAISLQRKETIK